MLPLRLVPTGGGSDHHIAWSYNATIGGQVRHIDINNGNVHCNLELGHLLGVVGDRPVLGVGPWTTSRASVKQATSNTTS